MNRQKDDVRYIEGKVYKSEIDGAITDETGLKEHWWSSAELFSQTFTKIYNKKRRDGNS